MTTIYRSKKVEGMNELYRNYMAFGQCVGGIEINNKIYYPTVDAMLSQWKLLKKKTRHSKDEGECNVHK